MKTLILSILVLSMASLSNAQNVNIPDVNFKNALISAGVDTNKDGEISYAECEGITYIDVGGQNISDMTGIEAFISLDTLWCNNNTLTSLNISNNTVLAFLVCSSNELVNLDVSNNNGLTFVICDHNQLTSLDVSNNSVLEYLGCYYNQLTSLDVSNNTILDQLYCDHNQLTSLDVSNNAFLDYLWCQNNQLTSLDISNDTQLINLDLSNMPALYEVCVWEMPFPPADVNITITGSPNINFTMDCSTIIRRDNRENSTLNICPNPCDDIINIEIEIDDPKIAVIEIYNVSGILIFTKVLHSKSEQIDVSGFSKGLYFVKVKLEETVILDQVVKK